MAERTKAVKVVFQLVLFAGAFAYGCGSSGGSSPCQQAFNTSRTPLAPAADSLLLQELRNNTPCASLLDGASRGLACLHCTQPQARAQAILLHRLLRQSCLRRISINYLVDGTFSFDKDFLINQISELTQGDRQVFISFFLANGAAQRRFDITRIDSFATQISPQEFRERIEHDPELQEQYLMLVRRLIPVLEHAHAEGARLALIPYLEDNLNNRAFEVLLALTQSVLPPNLPLLFGRNPCGTQCYPGNEDGIPPGVFEEQHTADMFIQTANGIVTNDGQDYASLATAPNPLARTCLNQLRMVRDVSATQNNSFILWSARRQGLPPDIDTQLFPIPAGRHYDVPTEAEQVEIIEFLREGLG